jgi:D-alanyl-D-alanine carboxypeptidase
MPKEKRYLLPIVSSGLILMVLCAVFFMRTKVSGQQSPLVQNISVSSQPVERERVVSVSAVQNDALVSNPNSSPISNPNVTKTSISLPSSFNANQAMSQNRSLKFNSAWAFGGKSQRGWYLYESLIQKLIGTEANAETPEFANAVAVWQQMQGYAPTGIIDNDTLKKMTETWQSERLGRRGSYATEDVLYNAPISDFWDEGREASRLKVERETYAAYKRMIQAAAKDKSLNLKLTATGELAPDEKFLRIVSGFRSREHQEALRKQSPNSGSAGLAVNSPHFTGHALDIYVGGEPVTTKDFNRVVQVQTPVYKWLVKNAAKFGFYPYFYEPWHWEYVPQNLRPAPAAPQNIPTDLPVK